MKIIRLFFYLILLCSCEGTIRPQYYPNAYEDITIKSIKLPQNVKAYVDEREVKVLRQRDDEIVIRVPRVRENKVLYLRRAGFKDVKVNLITQKTDELWAGDESAYWLSVPINTVRNTGMVLACTAMTPFVVGAVLREGLSSEIWLALIFPVAIAGWTATIPFNVAQDVYNMTIGIVSVNIKNPKYNYRVEDIEF